MYRMQQDGCAVNKYYIFSKLTVTRHRDTVI